MGNFDRETWLQILALLVGGPALIILSRRHASGWYFDIGLKLLGAAVITYSGSELLKKYNTLRMGNPSLPELSQPFENFIDAVPGIDYFPTDSDQS